MRCPVCGSNNSKGLSECSICGAKNINPTFLNKADITDWHDGVDFAKGMWFLEEHSPIMLSLTKEFRDGAVKRTIQQLDIYFGYSALNEKIKQSSQNNILKAWMIDYLVQIYTFPDNYPVSSRSFVKCEIEKYTACFYQINAISQTEQFHLECFRAVLSILLAEVEMSDGKISKSLSHYYHFFTNPIVRKGVSAVRAREDYVSNEDDIRYITHNCAEICKLLSLRGGQDFNRIVERLNEGFSTITENAFYMHGMDCGIIGPNDDEKSRAFLTGSKKHESSYENCNYQGKLLCTGLDSFGIGCDSQFVNGYNENLQRTWSVEFRTLEFNILDTIAKEKSMSQIEINRILSLFGC